MWPQEPQTSAKKGSVPRKSRPSLYFSPIQPVSALNPTLTPIVKAVLWQWEHVLSDGLFVVVGLSAMFHRLIRELWEIVFLEARVCVCLRLGFE